MVAQTMSNGSNAWYLGTGYAVASFHYTAWYTAIGMGLAVWLGAYLGMTSYDWAGTWLNHRRGEAR